MAIVETETGFRLTFGSRWSCDKPLSCKKCPLFRQLLIPPDLTDYKDVLMYGEGPGRDERKKMQPFTGMSGMVLREVVQDCGAYKFGVGYSNLLLCEGSGYLSDEDFWEAVTCCTGRIEAELAQLKPKLVVPLGNMPKQYFLPSERKAIGSIAGELYTSGGIGKPYDILPSIHPAAVTRNYRLFERFWDYMNEVRLFFMPKPGPFQVLIGSENSIGRLWAADEIFLDVETSSFGRFDKGEVEVMCRVCGTKYDRYREVWVPAEDVQDEDPDKFFKTRTFRRGKILCMSLNGGTNVSYVFPYHLIQRYKPQLKALLESKPCGGHNLPFDIPWVNSEGIFPRLEDDTMLRDYARDESPFHGLKRISRRYLGIQDWSQGNKQYLTGRSISYAAIPYVKLSKYNGLDTAALPPLTDAISAKMDEDEKRIYRTVLMPCARMFVDVKNRGIRVDCGQVLKLRDKWSKEKLQKMRYLRKYGIVNPNSVPQIVEVLNRLELFSEESEGGTKKYILERMEEQCKEDGNEEGEDFLRSLREYREIVKSMDTHLAEIAGYMADDDLCIHPDFKLFGTVTGRLTCGEPSLLNFPRITRMSQELRTVLIPRKGYIWGHFDQKQFELRVYAVVNDDQTLKQIFIDPRGKPYNDPHCVVGYKVHGPEGYERLNKETHGQTRTLIKTVVFGRLYMRGIESIAKLYNVPVSEAERYAMFTDELFPDVERYRDWVKQCLDDKQELVNPLGRKRRFPILSEENYQDCLREAVNFPIQSTASDLNLLGMLRLHDIGGDDIIPMFPVHDAIEFEVRESRAEELMKTIAEVLADVPRMALNVTDLKFQTDSRIGYNWSEASMD